MEEEERIGDNFNFYFSRFISLFMYIMAKHSRRHRSRSRGRGRSRGMSGGSYSSASTYGEYVYGSPSAQYNRVFDQAGAYGQVPGNQIIGAQGQNASPAGMPTANQLALVQKAGRRRRRRGGFVGEVLNQAVVPFALLGMQQTYRKKKGGRHRRTHRR